ncbi:MAG TPA: hypothetical protein PKH69_00195 [Thiobacillaceae bacterium]|nr:hypothetical protein [Thiobacillaceae bacterium]HNU63466.1 hypothetical protein [Thiobacillaceae bacterium]
MSFPDFFAQVPTLTLKDGLAELLGAAQDGRIEYRYADVVRLAGHSCPTVAGAWLMARHGLRALYADGIPERGNIRVEMRNPMEAGTTGVVGSVLGLVTGAAGAGGFKGLGGRFVRRNLLIYGVDLPAELRLIRLDTGSSVLLDYHPEKVPPSTEMQVHMASVMSGQADADERAIFGRLWQERVRSILLDHADAPGLVVARMGT